MWHEFRLFVLMAQREIHDDVLRVRCYYIIMAERAEKKLEMAQILEHSQYTNQPIKELNIG